MHALDWLPSVSVLGMTTKTLDKLLISPNSSLPEDQLTQEWFKWVMSKLSKAEEYRAAMAAAVASGNRDVVAEAKVPFKAGHERL